MKVTFLAHSGFLIQLEQVDLLFDWWQGDLPQMDNQKPLVVFASHGHQDHFKSDIFRLDDGQRTVRFLLGNDIKFTRQRRERWGLTPAIEAHCQRLAGNLAALPLPGVKVKTLTSTDAGVAFLVETEGKTIYHAGDLNWWYWAEEPDPGNPDMERDFQRYTAPLKGQHIDLALLPLDPRLEEGEDWGMKYMLELADIDKVIPMHQWANYAATDRFVAKYPQWADKILPVTGRGQVFEL